MDGSLAAVRVELVAAVLAIIGGTITAIVWSRFRHGVESKGNRIIELLSSILDELRKK